MSRAQKPVAFFVLALTLVTAFAGSMDIFLFTFSHSYPGISSHTHCSSPSNHISINEFLALLSFRFIPYSHPVRSPDFDSRLFVEEIAEPLVSLTFRSVLDHPYFQKRGPPEIAASVAAAN